MNSEEGPCLEYWKLGMIAHFHRASLLGFKDKIANAVETFRTTDEDNRDSYATFRDDFRNGAHWLEVPAENTTIHV